MISEIQAAHTQPSFLLRRNAQRSVKLWRAILVALSSLDKAAHRKKANIRGISIYHAA